MQEGTISGAGNVPIYFRRYGSGSRAVIVPNAAWLEPDLKSLAKDRTVIFYDPRGRGKSGAVQDKTQITLEAEIEDLDTVVRHFELRQVVLFGWSYQGAVVANYASRHAGSVLRLILSGPLAPRRSPYADRANVTLQSRLDMPAITALMKSPPPDPVENCRALNSILLRAYFFDLAAYERSRASPCDLENERPQNLTQYTRVFMSSLGDWDWRPDAARYGGPVLILHGDADWNPVEGSREWQASFPNARMLIVPSAGHLPWLEQGNMFFKSVNEFIGGAELDNWSWPAMNP